MLQGNQFGPVSVSVHVFPYLGTELSTFKTKQTLKNNFVALGLSGVVGN